MPANPDFHDDDSGRFFVTLSSRWRRTAALLCVFGCLFVRTAQSETEDVTVSIVTAANTTDPIEPAYLEPSLPAPDQATPQSLEPTVRELSPSPRRFHYRLSFDGRIAYDDNITLAHTDPVDDLYGRIEALLILGFGDVEGRQENYLGMSFAPSYYFYFDNSDFNAFEFAGRLDGMYRFSRLTLSVTQDLQSVQSNHLESTGNEGTVIGSANLDAGSRRRVTNYLSRLNATYDLTGKTSLSGGIDYHFSDTEDLIGSQSVSANVAIDYKFQPKVGIGLVGGFGKEFVDSPSPDQTFEHVSLRVAYDVSGKVTANASGGVEIRHFDGGTDDRVSPIFELGVTYQPFDGTTISLNGSGDVFSSSVFGNQDYHSTQVTLTIQQRLLQRITLSISAGVNILDYFSTVDGSDTLREDNYYFIQPGIDVNITRYWSAGVYYLHRLDDSSISIFGFEENQFGVHSRISF